MGNNQLGSFLGDAEDFLTTRGLAIDRAPLQTYSEAFAFSPVKSEVKAVFWHDGLSAINSVKSINYSWASNCSHA
jgi:hypothetical protein